MQNKKQGFSLAEMLMVMFVLAIIMGVSAPIITKQMRSGSGYDPWRWVPNAADIYSAANDDITGIFGSRTNAADITRLVVKIPGEIFNNWPINTRSHIVFQKGTDTVGRLVFGDDSIGLGNGALRRTDPGVRNVAIGFDAMSGTATPTPDATAPTGDAGSGNVAIGSRALRGNNSGQHNVAIGSQALMSSTSGSRNVALGFDACTNNNTNSNIVCLGKDTVVTGDNGVAIGNEATAAKNQIVIGSGANQIVIDNDANSILIGGSTGSTGRQVTINGNLEVNGTITTTGANDIVSGTTNPISLRGHRHKTKTSWVIKDCCTKTCSEHSYGWTSYSSYCPAESGVYECSRTDRDISTCGTWPNTYTCYYHKYMHFVDQDTTLGRTIYSGAYRGNDFGYGTVRFNNCEQACIDYDYPAYTDEDGDHPASHGHRHGEYTLNSPTPSDIRLKNMKDNNIDGLDKIRKLIVWNYSYKSDKENTPHVGVVAQELMKVFPNAVKKGADGYYLIRTEDIQYAMLNAIKELDTMVQKISNELKTIEDKIASIAALQKTNNEKISALDVESNSIGKDMKVVERDFKSIETRLKKLETKK